MNKKESTLKVDFEFLRPDPNLTENQNPQETCAHNFLIYIKVYMRIGFIQRIVDALLEEALPIDLKLIN